MKLRLRTLRVLIPFSDTSLACLLHQFNRPILHGPRSDPYSRPTTLCTRTPRPLPRLVADALKPSPHTILLNHPFALLALLHHCAICLDTILCTSICGHSTCSFEMAGSTPWHTFLCIRVLLARRCPSVKQRNPNFYRQHFQYMDVCMAHPSFAQRIRGCNHNG